MPEVSNQEMVTLRTLQRDRVLGQISDLVERQTGTVSNRRHSPSQFASKLRALTAEYDTYAASLQEYESLLIRELDRDRLAAVRAELENNTEA
jgi:hypothetical protein